MMVEETNAVVLTVEELERLRGVADRRDAEREQVRGLVNRGLVPAREVVPVGLVEV